MKIHTIYHKNGSVWAQGKMEGPKPEGYWEWFRTNGTKLRSGYFREGKQIGKWTAYDRSGNPTKVIFKED